MIITAKTALLKAQQNPKRTEKWVKNSMRQLRRIEKAIYRAAKKGKTYLKCYDMYNPVYEALRANGYKVETHDNYEYEWMVIRWKEET